MPRQGIYALLEVSSDNVSYNLVSCLQNINLQFQRETTDGTCMKGSADTGYRQEYTTFAGWNISADGFWEPEDSTGQQIIRDAMLNNTLIYVRYYPSAGTSGTGTPGTPETGDKYYTGQTYVSETSVASPFDGLAGTTLNFVGVGALTEGTEGP